MSIVWGADAVPAAAQQRIASSYPPPQRQVVLFSGLKSIQQGYVELPTGRQLQQHANAFFTSVGEEGAPALLRLADASDAAPLGADQQGTMVPGSDKWRWRPDDGPTYRATLAAAYAKDASTFTTIAEWRSNVLPAVDLQWVALISGSSSSSSSSSSSRRIGAPLIVCCGLGGLLPTAAAAAAAVRAVQSAAALGFSEAFRRRLEAQQREDDAANGAAAAHNPVAVVRHEINPLDYLEEL